MTVLVLNAGSSSLKYAVVDVGAATSLASGLAERVGQPTGRLTHRGADGAPRVTERPLPDHAAALGAALDAFAEAGPDLSGVGLTAVAHRVVHGGTRFATPVRVDDGVLAAVRDLAALAPLHNPVNATGIEVARRAFPGLPHVAVFDTAFHQTLPAHAHTYAVPRQWARDHGVRRYGFHGTSHAYVSRRAAEVLGRPVADTNVVVLHLGNGASATAVAGGRSVDTSMGLTPLEGLVMGTRSGDVDPAVVAHLRRTAGLDADAVDRALNSASGMLALAGHSDLREVHRLAAAGDEAAALALDVFCHRVRRYVGAYLAVLGRTDAVVFTAGIGENDAVVRARSLAGLETLGIVVDHERNAAPSRAARVVSADGSPVAVLVVPTDEELEMARQAAELLAGG
ncbi:acetate/propionate family kinase [Geodermatophilus sp. DSM 44513]|uniref:acetate/propionate family kinase n=1 Tax=Geodermatophilus sp. DSM 44513 TaxID=1528104 RepID=UPI00126D5C94|nr:acetate kinase [Geodermatophilus sp. DSM 44513]WNV74031.1 acetate kinase [Geodermatophilus sp. DSM 44513]